MKTDNTHGNFLVVYTEHTNYDRSKCYADDVCNSDNCNNPTLKDYFSAHESYEDAKAEYDDLLRRDNNEKDPFTLWSISITAMVESSDYTPWKGIDLNKLEEGANG